jgi:hypothetical protein
MHIKMADVASGQSNFVVATNALRKAKMFQIDDTEQLNSALNISLGKLSSTQNDTKKASLLDRMLNNVFSTTVSYIPVEFIWIARTLMLCLHYPVTKTVSNETVKKQMDFNLIVAQVLESTIVFMRNANDGLKLLQLSKNSRWMHQLNAKNQSIDSVLQVLCDGAYDHLDKAIKAVSHLVRKLEMDINGCRINTILIAFWGSRMNQHIVYFN